jgi:hypothetical protein
MATTKKTVDTTLPTAWAGADVDEFNGHELTDKADLIGTPFLIIGVQFEHSERGYDIAYVYALDESGTEFEFSDTSTTGVKVQIEDYLTAKGIEIGLDTFIPMRAVVRKGLRVSEFETIDGKGRAKSAKVYYLTTAGRAKA